MMSGAAVHRGVGVLDRAFGLDGGVLVGLLVDHEPHADPVRDGGEEGEGGKTQLT